MRNAFAALARWLAIGIGSLPIVSIPCSAQSVVDPTLQVQTLTSGLTNPTTMAFIGPGDILVLQKNDGRVRRVINGVLQAGEVLDVAVDNDSERGLLGIALHPAFPGTSFVYLYYTQSTSATTDTSGSPLANRVYRYTWNGSALVNPSLIISLPVTPGPNHNGGIIAFGPDGKLYAVIGDLNRNGQLQNYATSATPDDTSVILRLNDDGTIPADNPFFAQGGNLAKYYAYGIRNSFGLTFDPVTGRLWMTENGPSTYDEINQFDPGSNSGWERIMGPVARDAQGISDLFVVPGSHYSDPKFSWLDTVGPTAIAFLNSAQLGAAYQNNAFVGDINNGRLYRFRPNATRDALVFADPNLAADRVADSSGELTEVTFGTGFGGITDVKVGPDGLLHRLLRPRQDLHDLARRRQSRSDRDGGRDSRGGGTGRDNRDHRYRAEPGPGHGRSIDDAHLPLARRREGQRRYAARPDTKRSFACRRRRLEREHVGRDSVRDAGGQLLRDRVRRRHQCSRREQRNE